MWRQIAHLIRLCGWPFTPRLAALSEGLPLNPQILERLVVVGGKRFVLHLIHHSRMIHDFEMVQTAKHVHIALSLRRLPQYRRNQHPALTVHLHHLPVVAGPLQELALGLVLAGQLRQLLFNPHPNLQGINQRRFAGNARDVELISVLSEPVEKHGGYLETTLLVYRRPTVSPKTHLHLTAGSSALPESETQGVYLPICCLRSSNRPTKTRNFRVLTTAARAAQLPLLCPTSSHNRPLSTTFRHILSSLHFLSSKIVHF